MTTPSLDQLIKDMRNAGYRLSHLGLSGGDYYSVVHRGFDPLVNIGRGTAWGNTPLAAVQMAWEMCQHNQGDGKGAKLPANIEDLLK